MRAGMKRVRRVGASFLGTWACVLAMQFLSAVTYAQGVSKPFVIAGPTASPVPAFVDDEIKFQVLAADSAGGPLTYGWNFGDGSEPPLAGTTNSVSHRYTVGGRYPVTVRIKNTLGAVTGSMVISIHTHPTLVHPASASSIILDAFRGRVWCVNSDQGTVSSLDGTNLTLLSETVTGGSPQTLAQAPNGNIWVTNQTGSTLSVLSPDNGNLLGNISLPYGSAPQGIVFNPKDGNGYVTLEGSGKLIRLNPETRMITGELVLGPTPRGMAVTEDGKRIFVTRFISPVDHGEVWEVDALAFTRTRTIILALDESPDSETSGSGVLNYIASVVISPDGKEALVPCSKANTGRGPVRNGLALTSENSVRTVVAHIDLLTSKEDPLQRNDFDNGSLATASVFSPLGDLFFTALQGSNAVHALDPFNHGSVLERNKDVGAAPRGLALDGNLKRLFVHNFLDRAVAVFDVSSLLGNTEYLSKKIASISTVLKETMPESVLRGKRLFYNASDTRMSLDGYISCAACHLGGATDGRVWDFTDRGEGLRRTTNLLGRYGVGHGPIHWSANFDEVQDFENDMRGPFKGTGFMKDADFLAGTRSKTLGDTKAGFSPELDDLAAYVTSLARVHPSPFRKADGTMTEDALAGEKIFLSTETGCARCHIPPLYTDSRLPGSILAKPTALPDNGLPPGDFVTSQGFLLHDVGTLKPSSGKRLNDTLFGIDTPTLKGIWELSAFLHDGFAATVMDVISSGNVGDKHGKTSQLSLVEKERLVAFLMQLDDGDAPPAVRTRVPTVREPLQLRVTGNHGAIIIQLAGKAKDVSLSLLDMRGRMLKADFGAGQGNAKGYQWKWNGRTGFGQILAPGVYQLIVKTEFGWATASFPWVP
jgi:DNA-binding beta-propeller fold protein YncE/cytochrome c peroxidase